MRVVDTEKIERIKTETKILIVEKGYHGASVAEIAKRAKVSDGYLYRHYMNKSDLVRDIFEKQLEQFHDFIFELLNEENSVQAVLEGIIKFNFNLSKKEPYAIKFAHMLVYDHEFEYPKSRHDAINKLSKQILDLGKSTGEISINAREIDVQLTVLTIPVKFIEYSDKKYYKSIISEKEEMDRLVRMCINSLK